MFQIAESVIATATISGIDNLQVKTALVTSYTEDAYPQSSFGPNIIQSKC
jgi:hypothetical protein